MMQNNRDHLNITAIEVGVKKVPSWEAAGDGGGIAGTRELEAASVGFQPPPSSPPSATTTPPHPPPPLQSLAPPSATSGADIKI
ncbi:hypothetical protein E3N88_12874 [Mikania micrantha]|uniref:Uncharacterized protein n=1 Tax=Mikania micrantha TaxID=192012 RepID=A0A5N6P6T8_9ASTR|nr:hypothetical protein E3N88_12874 [Mikania micrantha]